MFSSFSETVLTAPSPAEFMTSTACSKVFIKSLRSFTKYLGFFFFGFSSSKSLSINLSVSGTLSCFAAINFAAASLPFSLPILSSSLACLSVRLFSVIICKNRRSAYG